MKINFEEMQKMQKSQSSDSTLLQTKAMGAYAKASMKAEGAAVKGSGFSVDLSGKTAAIGGYGRQKDDRTQSLEDMGFSDAAALDDKMLVCASTMSGEDYKKMVEEGVKPGKTEPGDAVNILDHIKAVMARSGQVIDGFNGEGDLDKEALVEMTGSEGSAQALSRALRQRDLPVSEENVKDMLSEKERADELTEVSDGMKQYMLENHLEPTLDNLYLARYSASGVRSASGGYFAEDLHGYIGKTTEHADIGEMQEQVDKVILQADLIPSDETREYCSFLMESDIPLTGDNLSDLNTLSKISLPMSSEELFSCMADAIYEGKSAKDADLTGESLIGRAEKIQQETITISQQAADEVILSQEPFTIRSLSAAQRRIETGAESKSELTEVSEDRLLSARKTLAEVQLHMTVSANMQLLKRGIEIDTTELTSLVEDLKEAETAQQQRWNLSLPDPEQDRIFAQTMAQREDLFSMPAAVLGPIADGFEKLSLPRVHEAGAALQDTFRRAGESYEALMTAPRADLGDRIGDAFSNIDDLLAEQELPATEDNRRAVRILAYNRMELSLENIANVKAADQVMQGLLTKMNPAATLQMIRDGINPLEQTIEELDEYFDRQQLDAEQTSERFSVFLYELEHSDGITPEEKETYMGIYRLLHQIEKGDGKAIGTVVNNGQELSFANLLSAVRTSKKGGIRATVDDSFGGAKGSVTKSISDQIGTYYAKKVGTLTERIMPEALRELGADMATTLDELLDSEIIAETKTAEELRMESYHQLQNAYLGGSGAAELLLESGIIPTADDLSAMTEILKDKGGVFKGFKELAKRIEKAASEDKEDLGSELASGIDDLLSLPLQSLTDEVSAKRAYEEFTTGISDYLQEGLYQDETGYLDVKAINLCAKQLTVMNKLSRQDHFELPAVIDGELTAVSLRFVRDSGKAASAKITIELSDDRQIRTELFMNPDKITGIVGTTDEDLGAKLERKMKDFGAKVLAETGKDADISIVYSETLAAIPASGAGQREAGGSPKELYRTAKMFLETLNTLS
ncbi:MAG: DUF6240 domain-containing protein [Lachnospiraceae bacterium]|nr:DUF6240 domain-containing protein [Lachnospiraceae bacterium]